jgi:hypothetical protein
VSKKGSVKGEVDMSFEIDEGDYFEYDPSDYADEYGGEE